MRIRPCEATAVLTGREAQVSEGSFRSRALKVFCLSSMILAAILFAGCNGDGDNANTGQGTANQSASPSANTSGGTAQPNPLGSIKATPNPVPAGTGNGKTTITWKTTSGEMTRVFVSQDGAVETEFASGPEGSQDAPWITDGSTYEFRLYTGSGANRKLIDKVQVARSK